VDKTYYQKGDFATSKEAWSHIEAHWKENNSNIARRLDWEGVKAAYKAGYYFGGQWHLLLNVIDYREQQPTPPTTADVIADCPQCGKLALRQRRKFPINFSYVHIMGFKDHAMQVPIFEHYAGTNPLGIIIVDS
jgi:hypothetical protein